MRKPRILCDGARYHVIARTNRKEMIMCSDTVKDLFLTTVARAKKKYDFRIENFCVMGNHFHMIIHPLNGASLSSIMQWIMSVFAMAWNRMHNLTGHVWGDRFYSRIIENFMEFIQVFRYIDANPVKAGLVQRAEDWRHGGFSHFRRGIRDIVERLPLWLALVFPRHHPILLK
jgi:putative transposase